MTGHRIRLAGPWEFRPDHLDDRGDGAGNVNRVQLPFRLPPVTHGSRSIVIRGFHRPTGLEPATQVILQLQVRVPTEAALASIEIRLNDVPVAPVRPDRQTEALTERESGLVRWSIELTPLLRSFNVLHFIASETLNGEAGLIELVSAELEIIERGLMDSPAATERSSVNPGRT